MNLRLPCKDSDGLNQRKIRAFVLNFIAIFLVYNALLQSHFSPDTFAEYVKEGTQYLWHISNARIVYALFHKFLYTIGLRVTVCASLYTFLFMLVSAWCAASISDTLCRAKGNTDEKSFFLCNLAALISMINFCILEWYLFPECMFMYTLALLGATYGALAFADKNTSLKHKVIVSFAWLFIGINSYQAVLGWFGALVLMSVLAQNDFYLDRHTFGMGFAAMCVGGVNAALNQALPKIVAAFGLVGGSERHVFFSPDRFLYNAGLLYNNQKDFFKNGYYMLPDYFLFGALVLGILLLFFALKKDRIRRFFAVGVALGVGYVLTMVPHLLSEHIWITFRTLPSVFLILSLIIISAILCGKRHTHNLSFILIFLTLLICGHNVSVIITDHMTTVHTDLAEGRAILREIEKHEKQTGNTIDELCFLRDKDMMHYYPGVTTMWQDVNPRHLTVEWEREPFIESLSGRDFTFITLSNKESEAIVQDRNWQYADYDEQIIFEENRAYIILY